MSQPATIHRDLAFALLPPLLVRLIEDGVESASARLGLLVVAFVVSHIWSAAFAGGRFWFKPKSAQYSFALLFVVMLPAPVSWGGAVLATSFGWVFAREVFGGEAILPPALVALAFAIFSFPQAGYEAQSILTAEPDWLLALACLPGAAWLVWRRFLSWQTVAGTLFGAAVASLLAAAPGMMAWWEHFLVGSFPVGVLFLAATPESTPQLTSARWLHGVMIGALVVAIRLFNPVQPDGVVLAALISALFAPLLDRSLSWRPQRG